MGTPFYLGRDAPKCPEFRYRRRMPSIVEMID